MSETRTHVFLLSHVVDQLGPVVTGVACEYVKESLNLLLELTDPVKVIAEVQNLIALETVSRLTQFKPAMDLFSQADVTLINDLNRNILIGFQQITEQPEYQALVDYLLNVDTPPKVINGSYNRGSFIITLEL